MESDLNRRLAGVGLSRRDPDALINRALCEIADFIVWIQRQACVITGLRTGQYHQIDHKQRVHVTVQAAHCKSRGSYGDDFGNIVPLAKHFHEQLHNIGDASFQAKYSIDLKAAARVYCDRYLETRPNTRAFLQSLPVARAA